MLRFLISFDDGTMVIPEADLPIVSDAARAVVREAKAAGVWIFGSGLLTQQASTITPDGTISPGPYPETKAVPGGLSITDVAAREGALQ